MKVDINKFSFAQLTSNSDGKTSASGTMGTLVTLAGVIGFLVGAIEYFIDENNDIMTQSIVVITIGAGLLGYRKSQPDPVRPEPEPVAEMPAEEPVDGQINS